MLTFPPVSIDGLCVKTHGPFTRPQDLRLGKIFCLYTLSGGLHEARRVDESLQSELDMSHSEIIAVISLPHWTGYIITLGFSSTS